MELKANSSNNTIFADADGDIAYFHGNFIPRRDTAFDWTEVRGRRRLRPRNGKVCWKSTRRRIF